jgi:hypothetical protein
LDGLVRSATGQVSADLQRDLDPGSHDSSQMLLSGGAQKRFSRRFGDVRRLRSYEGGFMEESARSGMESGPWSADRRAHSGSHAPATPCRQSAKEPVPLQPRRLPAERRHPATSRRQ